MVKLSRMAHKARSETAAEKPMFRRAWKRSKYCLIPIVAFCEPNWESGEAVRWRIERADRQPFAIAGIWAHHDRGDGAVDSFSMLTVNANTHPLMNHFHRPGDEERMLVIVDEHDYQKWLHVDDLSARGSSKLILLS